MKAGENLSLLNRAQHEIHCAFDVVVFQTDIPALWRHRIEPVQRVLIQYLDALSNAGLPGGRIALLRRPRNTGGMAELATYIVYRFPRRVVGGSGRLSIFPAAGLGCGSVL